nr:hypothetical protein [uncultured Mediterranean phage uvMED]
MGSLYDIGNFRYKHFTFYSCNEDAESSSCDDAPPVTFPNNVENDEIVNFLDRVWPHRGLFIGDSSEGDYCFVTYVKQTTDKIEVKNIYIYKRIKQSIGGGSTQLNADLTLKWERVLDEPITSLKPGAENI